jgi:hypothetical protein
VQTVLKVRKAKLVRKVFKVQLEQPALKVTLVLKVRKVPLEQMV